MVLETAITFRRLIILCFCGLFGLLALLFTVCDNVDAESFRSVSLSSSAALQKLNTGKPPYPGADGENVNWFIQVSDIHISKFYWKSIAPDFQDFINHYIKTIRPSIVFVTGDITDAKNPDKQGSRQFIEEWLTYSQVLAATGILNHTVWLDTRGNHDAFDVPELQSQQNFFKLHSVQGSVSYRYEYRTPEGNRYSFIALDACPDPGPRRPFNFFGLVTEDRIKNLHNYSEASHGSNMTVWFGHYPTSIIGSPHPGLRKLIGSEGSVYLCGHLHTLAGFVPSMYSPQQAGYLELELGDWKENRLFRVFAIDHDLFSFTDEVYQSEVPMQPVILITNPKDAKFIIPAHEPLDRIARSTHIRILVWSQTAVEEVIVSIDGKTLGQARQTKGPLYVLPWTPDNYAKGLHSIKVVVKDINGKLKIKEQNFSVDGSTVPFDFLRRFLLMTDIGFLLKIMFVMVVLVSVVPLLLVKVFIIKVQMAVSDPCTGCFVRFIQTWTRRYYLIAATPRVFYPLVISILYIVVGPLFVGPILDDHIGACFIWGIYVKGTFIPGTLTFLYASCHYLTFSLPLTLYVGRCLDLVISDRYKPRRSPFNLPVLRWLLDHIVCLLLFTWMVYLSLTGFAVSYSGSGYMALLFCPMRTWSVGLLVYLHWAATTKRSRGALRVEVKGPVEGDDKDDRQSLHEEGS